VENWTQTVVEGKLVLALMEDQLQNREETIMVPASGRF